MRIELEQECVEIYFDSALDRETYERWASEFRELLPRLWRVTPRMLASQHDFIALMQERGQHGPFRDFLIGQLDQVAMCRESSQRKPGRPFGVNTAQAMLRFLCFAPYEMVLQQEKTRRI